MFWTAVLCIGTKEKKTAVDTRYLCVCVCGPHTPVCVAGHRLLLFGRAPRQSTLVLGSEIWALDASAAVKLMLRLIV